MIDFEKTINEIIYATYGMSNKFRPTICAFRVELTKSLASIGFYWFFKCL